MKRKIKIREIKYGSNLNSDGVNKPTDFVDEPKVPSYQNRFWSFLFREPKLLKAKPPIVRNIDDVPPMTKREVLLRYSVPWRALLFFCLPTVAIMVVQGLYNVIDKTLALQFATPHAQSNAEYFYDLLKHNGIIHRDMLDYHLDLEEVWKSFFIGNYKYGIWDEWYQLVQDNPNQIGINIFVDDLMETGTLINAKKIEQYINLTTQYTTQGYTLTFAFNQAVAIGIGMVFAIEFGRGDRDKLSQISGNGFSFALFISLMSALLLFGLSFPGFNQPLIESQIPKQNEIIEAMAWKDIQPLIYLLPLAFLANYLMSLLRSEGKVIHIMIMVISSLLVKCGVAILLMQYTPMELGGAMMGTMMAFAYQLIYAFILIYFSKVSYTRFSFKQTYDFDKENILGGFKAGIPNFILYFAIFLNDYITTSLIGHLPELTETIDKEISTEQQLLSAMGPWNQLLMSFVIGMNQGTRTIIAFNYGANNLHRIMKVSNLSALLMTIWLLLVLLMIFIAGPLMLTTFAFPVELAHYGNIYYWCQVAYYITYPLAGLTYVSLGLFQGTNRSFAASLLTSFRSFTVFVPMTLIGYGISIATKNSVWFFICVGLNDLVCAFILLPIIYQYQRKIRADMKEHEHIKEPKYLTIAYDKYLELNPNEKDLRLENHIIKNNRKLNRAKTV